MQDINYEKLPVVTQKEESYKTDTKAVERRRKAEDNLEKQKERREKLTDLGW